MKRNASLKYLASRRLLSEEDVKRVSVGTRWSEPTRRQIMQRNLDMIDMWNRGIPRSEIGLKYGLRPDSVRQLLLCARVRGFYVRKELTGWWRTADKTRDAIQRRRHIADQERTRKANVLRREGFTLDEIGLLFGITRERVRQITEPIDHNNQRQPYRTV